MAWAPNDEWRLGAVLSILAGTFNSQIAFSGCIPERFLCAPEDPDWDVAAELKAGPIITPTGQIGVQYIPTPAWRVGASFHLPVWVRSGGSLRTRLPATPVFETARQEGEDVDVSFELPFTLRLGVETRAVESLRLELGFAWEHWSMHDEIRVNPDNVALRNVVGFPDPFYLPSVSLPKGYVDAVSVRAGGEYSFELLGQRWDARAGLSFETSAIPAEYLSVQVIDAPKLTPALGLGLHVGQLRIDATYAHVFAFDVEVAPDQARLAQVSPVDANPPRNPNYINGGVYSARADVVGLGIAYKFDAAP
jgi:long-chain fatty acid transport protein